MITGRGVLARAIGNAVLDGEWEPAAMARRVRSVVGRRAWVVRLVADVLEAYPRPPVDRPRELAAWIADSATLGTALERARKPVVVQRIPMVGARMALRRPWPVPPIDGEPELAELLGLTPDELPWFADPRGLQRRAGPGNLHHYRYTWLDGPRPRLLEAPRPRLRKVQRTVLDEILARIPVHPAAHGFVPGRSAVTGARVHVGAEVVVTLDLAAFFSSLTAARVYGVFRGAGYPQPVAHVLTGLCTTRTPVHVLRDAPSPDVRLLLREAHLPQGAPTSPALANLCVLHLDRRLAGLARAGDLEYTRYADDLTFSGALPRTDRLIRGVRQIVEDEGLRLQDAKTRTRRAFQRQSVTGIVVNERPGIDRREYDRLRAVLHNCAVHGPDGQNRAQHNDFRAYLLGRITWVRQLDPGRAARLDGIFATIVW